MAQTTTAENACDVKIKLENASAVLTDISGSSNQASIDVSIDTAETATFEGAWKIKKACKRAVAVSLQVLYTMTADEGRDILEEWLYDSPGETRTIEIDVPDSNVGSNRYSGGMILESFSVPLTADDAGVILCAASLSNNGAFAKTVIAS